MKTEKESAIEIEESSRETTEKRWTRFVKFYRYYLTRHYVTSCIFVVTSDLSLLSV